MAFKGRLAAGVAALSLVVVLAVQAEAQDVIVMRRVIAKPTRSSETIPPGTPTPTPSSGGTDPNAYYSWSASDWTQHGSCGQQGVETRTVSCIVTGGTVVDDSNCYGNNSGPKPVDSKPVLITTGCGTGGTGSDYTYNWSTGDWQADQGACGTFSETRSVSCVRSDGSIVSQASCAGSPPPETQTITDYSQCSFNWVVGSWGDPSTQCGSATETRDVSCRRSDGATVSEDFCPTSKPSTTQTVDEVGACSADWKTGDWGNVVPACGATVRTRDVTCVRADGAIASESSCTSAKPATTEPATDYSTCTDGRSNSQPYNWTLGDFGAPSTTCGTATETRTVQCLDGSGNAVADSMCVGTKPSTTQTSHETSGCTVGWNAGAWGVPQPACGSTVETRIVTCQRTDGTVLDDSACTGTKPDTTMPTTDYTSCSYGWETGAYSDPSTTCGNATETRDVYCQRSNGDRVDDSNCTGTRPPANQTQYQTSGCTATWLPGAWTVVPACGSTTESRTYTCHRSDGQDVDASNCTATPPTTSQATTDYSTCSYDWYVPAWQGAQGCGDTVTQTRGVQCERSDTTFVADSFCTTTKPASSQTITDYSGCGYSWKVVNGPWSSTCSDSATRTNTVTCTRTDGTPMDDSYCASTPKPSTTDTQSVTTSCTYTGTYGNPTTCVPDSQGATTGTQTVTVTQCTRSDSTVVGNGFCSPQSKTQTCTPDVTSTQFARYANQMADPSGQTSQSAAYRAQNSSTTANSLGFSVLSTDCWDSVNNKDVAASNCAALTKGANVYDVVSLPATIVPDLREAYINASDITAAMPHAWIFMGSAYQGCTSTSSYSMQIGGTAYTLRCGTPDSASHYQRIVSQLADPTGTNRNNNTGTGSTLTLQDANVGCWDSTANAWNNISSTNGKCQYLSGPSVNDLTTIPATYVQDLHEVYVNASDLSAAEPHPWIFMGSAWNGSCTASNSWNVTIMQNGTANTWTLRCGTPDSATHYQRQAAALYDPYGRTNQSGAYRYQNVPTANTLNFYVGITLCWDTNTGAQAANSAKCTYLPSGPNVNDTISLPATYVTDLHEVYINKADVVAAMPNSTNVLSGNINNICAGTQSETMTIGPSGSAATYNVFCGTPDSGSNYFRAITGYADPYKTFASGNTAAQTVNDTGSGVLALAANVVSCYYASNKTSAPSQKCTYLPNGPKVYDQQTVPATWNTSALTVTVKTADIMASAPMIQSSAVNNSSYVCGATWTVKKGVTGSYKVVCQ